MMISVRCIRQIFDNLLTEPARLIRFVQALRRKNISKLYSSYDDLSQLLDRDWINRVWTYQEILLASNPVVVCGHAHLSWPEFAIGIIFLEYSGINYGTQGPVIRRLSTWSSISWARDHIESQAKLSPRLEERDKTQLQKYQKFVVNVTQRMRMLHNQNVGVFVLSILISCLISMFWMSTCLMTDIITEAGHVPDSTVAAAKAAVFHVAECAQECEFGGYKACAAACSAASDAMYSVVSGSDFLTTRARYEAMNRKYSITFILAALVALISCLWLLTTRFTKRPQPTLKFTFQISNFDFVDALCHRKSREEKDIAFGVQAVLQKLSKTTIQPIERSKPLEEIYKQLCIQILKATGSVQFLLPATLNGFSGQPSWVPDWRAGFDPFWLNPTLFKSRPFNATPGSSGLGRLDTNNDNILIVKGHQICSVLECAIFQETWSTFDQAQERLHLHNLRVMLLIQRSIGSREFVSLLGFGLVQHVERCQFKAWSSFLKWAQDKELEMALLELRAENQIKGSFVWKDVPIAEIFGTHIFICNQLAKAKKMMFVASGMLLDWTRSNINKLILFKDDFEIRNDLITKTVCIGSTDVRVGDAVVLVSGVSSPLVIRRSGTSTTLVSPAIVKGAMDGEMWDPNWTKKELEDFILS
jgi:hypothetical protein